MRRALALPGMMALLLFARPATVMANRLSRAADQILFGVAVLPLVLMAIALGCAVLTSRAGFALLYYPVIAGLIAAASVPFLIQAQLSAGTFLVYGIGYGVVGFGIGGLAFLVRAVVRRHRTRGARPAIRRGSPGDDPPT